MVENRFEHTQPLFGVPQLGVIWLEFHGDSWRQKTSLPELSYSVVDVILGLAIFVQLRLTRQMFIETTRQTFIETCDRRTDKQTDRHTMTANTVLAQLSR